jgi:hypothetical protein
MKTYTITEFAKLTGCKIKTLQSWDRKGYLVPGRTPSNRRIYTESHLARLRCGPDSAGQLVVGHPPSVPAEIGDVHFAPLPVLPPLLRVALADELQWTTWTVQGAEAAIAYLQQWVQTRSRRGIE